MPPRDAPRRGADSGDRTGGGLLDCQYQYNDGERFVFMDVETFEQFGIPLAAHEARGPWLKEGETYTIVMRGKHAVDIRIPYRMVFTVAESESYPIGEGSAGGTKPVTTETGLVIRVPRFIRCGDRILVNSESCEYIERVEG